jgi:hypothetical protein
MSKTYAEMQGGFALVRARLLKLLHQHREGLTYERAHSLYYANFGHRAKTDNRLRELVALGWAEKRVVRNRMTFYAKQGEPK